MNKKISVEIQHFEGCPNGPKLISNVKSALAGSENIVEYNEILVETDELAMKYRFRGSPTLLINGEDFEGLAEPEKPSLSCRFYVNGIPSVQDIKQKIIPV